ncbi:MAG TPA: DUF86 domain-containing protein [Daejeonella sp.]
MSERNLKLLLKDISDAINHIQLFTTGLSFEVYSTDLKTKHAVCHNFTIIGEAASKFPKEFRDQYQQVAWQSLKDFRNFIVHEYFGLDDTIVWEIIQNDLPELLPEIGKLLDTDHL